MENIIERACRKITEARISRNLVYVYRCKPARHTKLYPFRRKEEGGGEQGREKWRDRQRKKKNEREIKKDRHAFQFPVGVS